MKADSKKRAKLEGAGWRVGSADELLGLSADESRAVAAQLPELPPELPQLPPCLLSLRVPEGWTLEALPRDDDRALLSTPSPRRYMATIDFRARGIRSGYSVSGRFVGEEWNKRRKKYGGRGWRQALLDDAATYLRALL